MAEYITQMHEADRDLAVRVRSVLESTTEGMRTRLKELRTQREPLERERRELNSSAWPSFYAANRGRIQELRLQMAEIDDEIESVERRLKSTKEDISRDYGSPLHLVDRAFELLDG